MVILRIENFAIYRAPLGSEILSSESEIALEEVEHEFLFKKVLG
ncbi:hypothetical protein LEP1GSC021_4212 [Leptospira noguchii str. 1993005606]|uniref:Uncharacterized protein n=2 Tax=Leptospira noguchii TaxID=28182 RepID=M6Y235_9LEPT|nr:hypothetical protein LEP1GSC035_2904 [Leptospira noguchii str. 2007001578]EMO88387.1 hypothetical protein LEP1GSC024_4587 [Leptospira noguchii str. 2001034031]EPE82001.1 hypothetical protein LEP1GSC021_4212 [Leptospira noguchii str. 1993005606]